MAYNDIGIKKVRKIRYVSWLVNFTSVIMSSLIYKYWNKNLMFIPVVIAALVLIYLIYQYRCPNCMNHFDIRKDIGKYNHCPYCGIRFIRN